MFSYDRLLAAMVEWTRASYPRQVLDEQHRDCGAFIAGAESLWEVRGFAAPDVSNHSHTLACACYAFLADGSLLRGDEELFERVRRAIAYLRRSQRPTGLIDLPSTNFESPPDTAFAIQLLAPAVELARRQSEEGDERAGAVAGELGEFIRTGAEGVIGRGFHTANHRWVICGALARAMALYPKIEAKPYIARIMAEGIDLNDDGEFTERSAVIYNAVCDRSLRFMADHLARPDLLDPVRKNLDLMLHLFHEDGTVVTSTSVREDRGRRIRPYSIADSFFDMAQRDGDGVWARAADTLLDGDIPEHCKAWPFDPFLAWLFEPFVSHPEYRKESLARKPLPDNFRTFFPVARLWRVRRGPLSATAAAGHTTAFAVRYGEANLKAVKLFGSYVVTALFAADEFEQIGDAAGVRMVHRGQLRQLPGYDLPLGRPVHWSTFNKAKSERTRWTQPPMDIALEVREAKNGFDLAVRTEGGLDRIMFQIECCFEGPGEWETDGMVMQVENGQTVILKQGYGTFHRGQSGIRVGPGACAHRVWHMRNTEPEAASFRVLVTLETPVDRAFEIRYGTWSTAMGELLPI